MLSVPKRFHQMVKYGQQRSHILQDLAKLETCISMKVSKTENRFQQPNTGLPKNNAKLLSEINPE